MSVALADYTSAGAGQNRSGATSERYGCEGASGGSSAGETGADGGSISEESREAVPRLYTGSDDEDSSVLEDLTAMFPLLDQEVLTTVLHAHEGRLEAAIDYLMAMNCQRAEGVGDVMPDPAPQRFMEDIGGLPELIPSFINDDEEDEEEFEDRLPSYDEIYPPLEPGPPPYSPPSRNHSHLPPTRGLLGDDPFNLPPINYLPQTDYPTVTPSRESLPTDSPTVTPSRESPQTDSPTVAPSRESLPTDNPTVAPSRESLPTDSLTEAPSRESLPTDSPTEAPSRESPQTDSLTEAPSMDLPQVDNSDVTANGDQHLQDSSLGAVGGGFESNFSDFVFQRSGRPEQAHNVDVSSDEDFDHREGE